MMTKEELEKWLDILEECDGGCGYCINKLHKLALTSFPEWREEIRKRMDPIYDTD
jgi:tRNA A37 methylthiotransferase MiaB